MNLFVLCLLLGVAKIAAQSEPAGLLIYHEPAASYFEAREYRSVRRDNALYATVVFADGRPAQLRAAGIVAAIPYPPVPGDALTAATAEAELGKIDALLVPAYAQVRPQLAGARGKWARALAVLEQNQRRTAAAGAQAVAQTNARSLTAVTTSPAPPTLRDYPLTSRVLAGGNKAIAFIAGRLGLPAVVVRIWTCFVVVPALLLLFMVGHALGHWRARRVTLRPGQKGV